MLDFEYSIETIESFSRSSCKFDGLNFIEHTANANY